MFAMRVSAWKGGRSDMYGIRVGAPNRDRYFHRGWSEIEVEIDGRVHRFKITPGFWNKCPEFRDRGTPTIRNWLVANGLVPWKKGSPPKFTLEPVAGKRFRLRR